MREARQFPPALRFLNGFIGIRDLQYRDAPFLKSAFEEPLWHLHFGKAKDDLTVDFRVQLDDGSLLTDHLELVTTFKAWICLQGHFDMTGGHMPASDTASMQVVRLLTLQDYLLLHSEDLKLADHGLKCVTENDLKLLVSSLASSHRTWIGIYEFPRRLTTYLREQIARTDIEILQGHIAREPNLGKDLPAPTDRILSLSDDELVLARAWLRAADLYKPTTYKDYSWSPKSRPLTRAIYRNTLAGHRIKIVPAELCFAPLERYSREFPAVNVHTAFGGNLGERGWGKYKRVLLSLGLLADAGLSVPIEPLRRLSTWDIQGEMNLRGPGRFRTLPKEVVFSSLRNSIEFARDYGEDIVASTIAVLDRARKTGEGLAWSEVHDISELVTPKLRKLGVKTWRVSAGNRTWTRQPNRRSDYLGRVRANEGLWELLIVLYGCVQISVGTLMARRKGELVDLRPGKCLDKRGRLLHFDNRKTGALARRQRVARPIHSEAARQVKLLEKLHSKMRSVGNVSAPLFAPPNPRTGTPVALTSAKYCFALDLFCDYFETDLNDQKQRYYIRQHQLRRFFAMAFFWGSSFGGVETLRWFLGHVDAEYLYNYITEMMTGEALRTVKAEYALERTLANGSEAAALADLLERRYHTRDFSVLDAEELGLYIEDLIARGDVSVEPEFLSGPKGENYRVLIKVSQGEAEHADRHPDSPKY